MSELWRALSAESLKLKRTLALWLALSVPIAVIALQLAIYSRRSAASVHGNPFVQFDQQVFMTWALLALPLYGALASALTAAVDHQDDHWKHLFALPVSPRVILIAKWVGTLGLVAVSFGVLSLGLLAAEELLRTLKPAWSAESRVVGLTMTRAVQGWLASALFVSIQLWISLRWRSFVVGLGVGIVAVMLMLGGAATLGGASAFIRSYPWALPVTAIARIAEPDAFRLPAVTLGALGGLLLAAVACWDLSRREWC